MPYEIKKIASGYKVFKKGTKKSFSKSPLPKKRAEKQLKALYAAEGINFSSKMEFEKLFLEKIKEIEKKFKI